MSQNIRVEYCVIFSMAYQNRKFVMRYSAAATPAQYQKAQVAYAIRQGIPKARGYRAYPNPASYYARKGRRGVTSKFAANPNKNEIKTLDLTFTGAYNAVYTPDTQPQQVLNLNTGTGSIQALTLIQQGVGISQRVGNKVCLKSLRLRFNISQTGVGGVNANAPTRARIMVLYDRNPSGAYVATSAILGASNQGNTITPGTYSDNLDPNQFDRYIVMMDDFITLPVLNTIAAGDELSNNPTMDRDFMIDKYIKLKNLECIYKATSNPAVIANESVGSLIIMTVGDTAAAGQPWCLTGTARLRFSDI
nr:MAG: capsid protein [Cressdnaviricota sp.]